MPYLPISNPSPMMDGTCLTSYKVNKSMQVLFDTSVRGGGGDLKITSNEVGILKLMWYISNFKAIYELHAKMMDEFGFPQIVSFNMKFM